jgi:hypothetical protein
MDDDEHALITQFYEAALLRYGADSEETLAFSRWLSEKKSVAKPRADDQCLSEEEVGNQTEATVMPSVTPPPGHGAPSIRSAMR